MRALRLFAITACVAGCATNLATGRRQLILMSEAEEVALGRQADAEIRQQMGVYGDEALQRYITEVGMRLVRSSTRPDLPWSFAVVDDQAINAFALPGGFVYLTRGILPFLHDEAEMAGVLGHEIGHVDGRHSAEAYSRQTLAGGGLAVAGIFVPATRPFQSLAGAGLGLLFLKHGREAELEADGLGVRFAAAGGWDPAGVPGMLNTLGRLADASGSTRGTPNWALTHPPAADRVDRVREAVAAARTPTATATNRPEFERHLDGLVFGDSREKGLVRGREFLHPILRFALEFPEGWTVINSDQQVAAVEREDGNVALLLQLVSNPDGSVEETARTTMGNAGLREVSGRRTSINGLTAYVGTYDGTISETAVGVEAALVETGGRMYLLAGLATAADFSRVRGRFTGGIESFRELSQAEADRIQPDRIDFRAVRAGETWESIARDVSGGLVRAPTLAIMNGSDPGIEPRPGDRIRVVIGG